jgi:hypothetical protein
MLVHQRLAGGLCHHALLGGGSLLYVDSLFGQCVCGKGGGEGRAVSRASPALH